MRNSLYYIIYLIVIAAISVFGFKKQEYNWDMLPYMAVVLSYDHQDFNITHDVVYNTIKEKAPASDYRLLTDGGVEMRRHSAENANYFRLQMPFYTIKPLYTRTAHYLYKAGIPLEKATVLPSLISYFLIGVLIFFWLGKYMPLSFVFPLSLLIMLCGFLTNASRISSPDCLSSLLVLSAFYCLIEKKSLSFVLIFLMLSIFARIDNIIFALVIVLSLALTDKWKEKLSIKKSAILILMMCACYFVVSNNVKEFGWSIFYYPSFIGRLNTAHNSISIFSFSNYFLAVRSQIIFGLFYSHIIMFLLLGGIILLFRNGAVDFKLDFDKLLVIASFIIIFTRFFLQPAIAIEDRFYIPYYVCILILLIKKISIIHNKQSQS